MIKRKDLRDMLKKVLSNQSKTLIVVGVSFLVFIQAFVIVQSQMTRRFADQNDVLMARYELDQVESNNAISDQKIEQALLHVNHGSPGSQAMYGMQLLNYNYYINSTQVGNDYSQRKTFLFYDHLEEGLEYLSEKNAIKVQGEAPVNKGEILVDRISYYDIYQTLYNTTENLPEESDLELPLSITPTFEVAFISDHYNFTQNLTITGVVDLSMDSPYVVDLLRFEKKVDYFSEYFQEWNTHTIDFKIYTKELKELARVFIGNIETGREIHEDLSSNFNVHKLGVKLNVYQPTTRGFKAFKEWKIQRMTPCCNLSVYKIRVGSWLTIRCNP